MSINSNNFFSDCNKGFLKHNPAHPPVQPHRALPVKQGPKHAKKKHLPNQPIPTLFEQQTEWQELIRQGHWDTLPQTAHCPIYRQLDTGPVFLLVHLFSGRRRQNNFHEHLQQFVQQMPFQLIVLSLDTAISAEYGDLSMTSGNWKTLLRCYEEGKVAGTLCGPPCETFSEARFTPPSDDATTWPRPLRSAARLFGLPNSHKQRAATAHRG